jgi:Ni,Fe-hydrogenase III small subunit
MARSLRETYDGMPEEKVVIAVGADACGGGLLGEAAVARGASAGPPDPLTGVGRVVPVDVWIGGSPPSPFGILNGLLAATGRLGRA